MKRSIMLLCVVLFCLLIVGCYTTFKHPHVENTAIEEEEYQEYHVSHMDDCSQCHVDDQIYYQYGYDAYNDVDVNTYNSYNWDYYHDTPWWSAPVYYSSPSPGKSGSASLPPTQKRDYQRRNTSGSNVSTSSPPPPSSAVSKSSANSGSSSSQQNTSSSDKRTVQRRDTSTEKSSKTRRDTSTAPKKKKGKN